MSFLKQYVKNNCRICKKTFCCQKCRTNHESLAHEIHPNCDICIYGYIYISTADELIIAHIEQRHWPLNCINCKRLFGSMNELMQHIKCPLQEITNSKTPIRVVSEENFESPPIAAINTQFFSSTPIQIDKDSEDKDSEFPDTITPIDRKAKIKDANKNLSSNHTPCDVKKGDKNRRVTFNETPITENCSKKTDGVHLKTLLKKCCMQPFSECHTVRSNELATN